MITKLMKKYALTRQGAKDLILATIACTISDLILMIPVALMYYLVGDLLNGTLAGNEYWFYGVGVVVAIILMFILQIWQYNTLFFATYRESGIRRIGLAEKLRKLPLSFFGKKDSADLSTVILGDCAVLEHAFSHHIPQYFGSIISTVIIAVSLFFFDWRMALAAVWVLPISLVIVLCSKKIQNGFSKRKSDANLAVADGIQECIETVRDLKSNNAESRYLNGLNKKIDKAEKKQILSELGGAAFVVPAQMLLKLGIATVALVGGMLLVGGSLSLLTFFMFLIVVSRIYEPMSGTLMNLAAVNALQVNVDRMDEIMNGKELGGSTEFEPHGYDIEFQNVGFAYEDGETVLDDVSFTAKQGEVTALVGESGGGKSTAAKLAARFWDVQRGTVKVGGVDVKTIDPETLLSCYSIVFQDVVLFNNSVMENIRIGRKNATDREVIAAARQARCEEFISKLPNGYDTNIGENGSTLSGGERQRISIARALLKNAPIILLDEATASLDAENETEVQEAISELIKDKTVLIIAHRLRTVEGAEKIVVLKGGKIAEQGTPQELKAKNGIYARMAELQSRNA